MSDQFGGPRFPGELSNHLPTREDPVPRNRWIDRLRHAWTIYLLLAIVIPLYLTAIVLPIVMMGTSGWFFTMFIALSPLVVYGRVLQLRYIRGRDPETGEQWRQDRH